MFRRSWLSAEDLSCATPKQKNDAVSNSTRSLIHQAQGEAKRKELYFRYCGGYAGLRKRLLRDLEKRRTDLPPSRRLKGEEACASA
jgi:hypothetical protein